MKTTLPIKGKIASLLLLFSFSYILLSFSHYPLQSSFHLKVVSSNQEVSQLFWATNANPYSEQSCVTEFLKPGEHDYRFNIEPSYTLSKLRFDPSVRESTVDIKQVVLKWDRKVVVDLSGERLREALRPINDVIIQPNQLGSGVTVISTGKDPILELNVAKLSRAYRVLSVMKLVSLALFFSLLVYIPIHYMATESYANDSHFTYPEKKRHWVYWGVAFFLIGCFFSIVTPIRINDHSPTLSFISISYIVGTLLFVPAFWFTSRKEQLSRVVRSTKLTWFWFALPSFVIWLLYLLSFWPGSMSPDSLLQWKQVLNGHLRDWHPAFHTMCIWLITRIQLSPATVAIAQILALGSTVGWALSVLQRYGVPKVVLWFTSVLFALWPVNGFMVITLWKDIAYSIALLVLAIYLFQIVMQKGEWLASLKNVACLAFVLALVCLYRHNGLIPVCGTSILLLCCYSRYWKGIVIATVLALLINAGVRGPLYDALDVRRGNPMTEIMQKLQHDLSFVSVSRIQNKLQHDLSINSISRFFGLKAKTTAEEIEKPSINTKIEPNKEVTQHTGKVWDRIYSASPLWRINRLEFYHKRFDYVNLWQKGRGENKRVKYVSSNSLGITANSILPAGKDFLYMFFDETRYNKYLFWMWRPAVYLYSLAGLTVLLSWRLRKKMYLVLGPSLLNSLPMFLVVIHKSIFRYHYPIVVLSVVLILPLLFLKNTQEEENSSA